MRLLIHHASYERLASEIAAVSPAVRSLVMDDAGHVSLEGQPVEAAEVRPDICWLNTEVAFGTNTSQYLDQLRRSESLGWLQISGAGVENPLFAELVVRGAKLTRSDAHAVAIADYVLWGVLDAFQSGAKRRAAQSAALWRRDPFRDLAGSRWLIVGFGAIGKKVGARARAFGAHVTGTRRTSEPDEAADQIVPLERLRALLPDSDVVVLSCSLTAETHQLCNGEFLGAMKPGSVLVNVGRGGLVDEAALLAALSAGVPEHAVLDVFDTEPLPTSSPLWRHPAVTATAHLSGKSAGNIRRNDDLFLDNLRRYVEGRPLRLEVAASEVLSAYRTAQAGRIV